MHTTDNYRYPGSRSFLDTDHDRRLFFGRERERRALLNLVLAENLVILFAKSGMGKTSLINAGLLQLLRETDFISLNIKFPHSEVDPLQAVYQGIDDAIEQHKELYNIEYKAGEKDTLWQYFKTVEFWSANDKLLTPVLILDQFEDFFVSYPPKARNNFITQLADLGKGRIPAEIQKLLQSEEEFPYTETSPDVKVIISIREDYIGLLEEMVIDIPDILQNRFRLSALNREQARRAIEEPAKVEGENLKTKSFHYTPEAVETILHFLCKQRKQDEVVTTDEAEPFQLQLLCHHIEENIVCQKVEQGTQEIIIRKEDLGDDKGMQKVIENFYEKLIEHLTPKVVQKRVRWLCEEELISPSGMRRRRDEEDIVDNIGVPKTTLAELVKSRLLRSEPWGGSFYYELSHDTLIEPIRESQRKRKLVKLQKKLERLESERRRSRRKRKIKRCTLLLIVLTITVVTAWQRKYVYKEIGDRAKKQGDNNKAVLYYHKAKKAGYNEADLYYNWGEALLEQRKYDEAVEYYQQAIQINPEHPDAYNSLGIALYYQDKYNEAAENFQKAIKLSPKTIIYYESLATTLRMQKKYDEAIKYYKQAIELDPTNSYAYKNLADAFSEQGEYDEAIKYYEQAIELNPMNADAYHSLAHIIPDSNKAVEYYQKAIEIDPLNPNNAVTYYNLGNVFSEQGEYDEAIKSYQKAIEFNPEYTAAYNNLGKAFVKQKQYDEAIKNYQKAIELYPQYAEAYKNLADAFSKQDKYDEAIKNYQKAVEINTEYTAAYKNLGQVFFKQDKYDEALKHYQKVVELAPDDGDVYKNIGDTFSKQGKYKRAIQNYQKAIEIKPNQGVYEQLALLYINQEQFEQSLEIYQRYLERDFRYNFFDTIRPMLVQVLKERGKENYIENIYSIASKHYRKAIELALTPPPINIYQELIILYIKQGQIDQALEVYQGALQAEAKYNSSYSRPWYSAPYPTYSPSYSYQYKVPYPTYSPLYSSSGYDGPYSTYSRSSSYPGYGGPYPTYPATYTILADVLKEEGLSYQIEKIYEIAFNHYRKFLQFDPDNDYLYSNLGKILSEQGKYEEASENYQKAIELAPKNVSVDTYRELAILHVKQGQIEQALELYQQYLRIAEPDMPYRYGYRSFSNIPLSIRPALIQTLKTQGMEQKYIDKVYEVEFEHYQDLIQRNPQNITAYNQLANVLLEQKKYKEAIEYYQKVFELTPRKNGLVAINQTIIPAETYRQFAVLYIKQGQIDQALKIYQRYLADNPPLTTSSFFHMRTSLIYTLRNQGMEEHIERIYRTETEHYRQIIQRYPQYISAYYSLAMALLNEKNYDDAIEKCKQAIELAPEDSWSYHCLGVVLYGQGKHEEATENFQKALQIAPKGSFTHHWLGYILLKQGKYEEAIKHFQKAFELNSNNIWIRTDYATIQFMIGDFAEAYKLVKEGNLLESVYPEYRLVPEFVVIASLLFQEKRSKALQELERFITYYQSLSEDYPKVWRDLYNDEFRNFIGNGTNISETDRTLLLTLIDILEMPKPEAKQKLEELKISLPEIFVQ